MSAGRGESKSVLAVSEQTESKNTIAREELIRIKQKIICGDWNLGWGRGEKITYVGEGDIKEMRVPTGVAKQWHVIEDALAEDALPSSDNTACIVALYQIVDIAEKACVSKRKPTFERHEDTTRFYEEVWLKGGVLIEGFGNRMNVDGSSISAEQKEEMQREYKVIDDCEETIKLGRSKEQISYRQNYIDLVERQKTLIACARKLGDDLDKVEALIAKQVAEEKDSHKIASLRISMEGFSVVKRTLSRIFQVTSLDELNTYKDTFMALVNSTVYYGSQAEGGDIRLQLEALRASLLGTADTYFATQSKMMQTLGDQYTMYRNLMVNKLLTTLIPGIDGALPEPVSAVVTGVVKGAGLAFEPEQKNPSGHPTQVSVVIKDSVSRTATGAKIAAAGAGAIVAAVAPPAAAMGILGMAAYIKVTSMTKHLAASVEDSRVVTQRQEEHKKDIANYRNARDVFDSSSRLGVSPRSVRQHCFFSKTSQSQKLKFLVNERESQIRELDRQLSQFDEVYKKLESLEKEAKEAKTELSPAIIVSNLLPLVSEDQAVSWKASGKEESEKMQDLYMAVTRIQEDLIQEKNVLVSQLNTDIEEIKAIEQRDKAQVFTQRYRF